MLMLKVEKLCRLFLRDVELSVAGAEVVTLSGPSGSGKSLLLRAIADLDPNTARASIGGKPRESMSAPEWRRRVGYLANDAGWWADRVGDHFPDGADATQTLTELGLPAAAVDWPVSQASSGELQRLSLARMLLRDPEIMLLDEPTSNLDSDNCLLVEEVLKRAAANGRGILIVTHDRSQAERIGGRRLLLREGKISGEEGP